MNIVIIEDERLTGQRLEALIKKYDASINVLERLMGVKDSIDWFRSTTVQPDLLFLDIHLQDGDSFQIISELDLKTPIIFTTAFDEYMMKAFKVNSIDYLLKPINYQELAAALDKFKTLRDGWKSGNSTGLNDSVDNIKNLLASLKIESAGTYKDRFMITVGTKIRTIKTQDIAYFFLEEKAVMFSTFEGAILPVDYSLDKLMQMLNPKDFFRINRQCIVSVNSISVVHAISAGKLKIDLNPKSRTEVFVSGDKISEFKAWLGK